MRELLDTSAILQIVGIGLFTVGISLVALALFGWLIALGIVVLGGGVITYIVGRATEE